jgi:hypothetical protein
MWGWVITLAVIAAGSFIFFMTMSRAFGMPGLMVGAIAIPAVCVILMIILLAGYSEEQARAKERNVSVCSTARILSVRAWAFNTPSAESRNKRVDVFSVRVRNPSQTECSTFLLAGYRHGRFLGAPFVVAKSDGLGKRTEGGLEWTVVAKGQIKTLFLVARSKGADVYCASTKPLRPAKCSDLAVD